MGLRPRQNIWLNSHLRATIQFCHEPISHASSPLSPNLRARLGGARVSFVSARNVLGANSKLNIASVGVGGKGAVDVAGVSSENLIGLCDVDANRLAAAGKNTRRPRRSPTGA